MAFLFAPPQQVVIPVDDERYQFFPVNRVFGIALNYPNEDGTKPTPFYFMKSPDTVAPVRHGETLEVPYPVGSNDMRHEVEVVAALGKGGRNLTVEEALDAIWGYAAGIDLSVMDAFLPNGERDWMRAKNFEKASPVSALRPHWRSSLPMPSEMWLYVNNEKRQGGSTAKLIVSIAEQIAELSKTYNLAAGDIIFTGTPLGASALKVGDTVDAGVNGVGKLRIKVVQQAG